MTQEKDLAAAIKAFVTKAQSAPFTTVDAAIDQYAKDLAHVIAKARPTQVTLPQGLRLTAVVNGISTTFRTESPLTLQLNS